MHRLLVSSFSRLLEVRLSPDFKLEGLTPLHEGRGIYFGLTRIGERVFVVERNLDVNREKPAPEEPSNGIREYHIAPNGSIHRSARLHQHAAFEDLHQIAAEGAGLLVTTARAPFLYRYDPETAEASPVALEDGVPEELRRSEEQREEREDLYHFNSIGLDTERLFLLAHNWNQPSFALVLSRPMALLGEVQVLDCYSGLGAQCHDILPHGGFYWILDSAGGGLLRLSPDGEKRFFGIEASEDKAYPRGLAVLGDKLVIAYNFWSEQRGARSSSRTMLTLFDPAEEAFVEQHSLGEQGNSCAILAL